MTVYCYNQIFNLYVFESLPSRKFVCLPYCYYEMAVTKRYDVGMASNDITLKLNFKNTIQQVPTMKAEHMNNTVTS